MGYITQKIKTCPLRNDEPPISSNFEHQKEPVNLWIGGAWDRLR